MSDDRERKTSNDDREIARDYHEITKHSYTSVRSSPHYLDWDIRPRPYKIYPAAGMLALPRELILPGVPTTAAIAGRGAVRDAMAAAGGAASEADAALAADAAPLDLETVTRLLFCADGLTRSKIVDGDAYHFRAAASAGALYPIEIYLAAAEVDGLEAGLYHFSPGDLRLRGLRRGDWRGYLAAAAAARPSILEARAVIVMSAIFWRSAWKYRARAWRYCYWDAGTVLANLVAAANAEGLTTEVLTAFADEPVEALIGADGDREGAVGLVAIGRAPRAAVIDAHAAAQPALELESLPLSAREVAYEDIARMQRGSRLATTAEVRAIAAAEFARDAAPPAAESIALDAPGYTTARGLGETILRRGSSRSFAREPIAGATLAAIMATARHHLHADFAAMVEPYVIVNAVTGVAPGLYYYQRETGALELIRSGEFRGEAGYLCLEQPLGADCSVLICYTASIEKVLAAYGNRGYRDAHLEAGLLGGRAYLAAYALGAGATGLTFYDDDTAKFLAPHGAAKNPLLMVAVGMPRRRPTPDEESPG
ncbi:MAG: SagB/ThcOx family dehydrogenase [Candidatus Binataceae bacterium]|nr:SagB/ThcOx family dehydrogenase [Candidatus Binataceae bacterium]